MRIFWIGVGLLTVLITVVAPYVASERCKGRWEPLNLEGVWDYKTGCSVRIGGSLVREQYVSFAPRNPTGGQFAKPLAPNQALAHPNWVTLGPDGQPVAEGSVRMGPQ
jgi:hypothetical protein